MIGVAFQRIAAVILVMSTLSCTAKSSSRPFGRTPSGEAVDLYTLTNSNGMEAAISTYGGVVVSLKVPDRNAGRCGSGFRQSRRICEAGSLLRRHHRALR